MNFIPHVFIGIGANHNFFTLRQTYLRVVGRGSHVISEHVKNLSQDPDEAIKLAREYASEKGMILKTERHELPNSLEEIQKRRAEEVAAARAAQALATETKAAAEARARRERREAAETTLQSGVFTFGKHKGERFEDHPEYCKWLVQRMEEFDAGSILEFCANVIKEGFSHLIVSPFVDRHLKAPEGSRTTITGIVRRVMTFDGFYGVSRVVVIQADSGEQVVAKGKWYAEEGKVVRITGTVKEKSVYRNEKQTILNRVKELNNV